MTTTIEISSDLLQELQRDAEREGKTVENIVAAVLRGRRQAYYPFGTAQKTAHARWWHDQLQAGRISGMGDSWPTRVTGTELHASYVAWCEERGIKPTLTRMTIVMRFMNRWLGPKKKTRGEVQGKKGRPIQYRILLPLNPARRLFDEVFERTTVWKGSTLPAPVMQAPSTQADAPMLEGEETR